MIRLLVGVIVAPLLLTAITSQVENQGVVSIFESGGISDETLAEVAALGDDRRVLTIDRGTLRLMGVSRGSSPVQALAPGFGIPMAASAFDPGAADGFVPAEVLEALSPGTVVMSERSASLRGASAGDTVVLEGWDGVARSFTISAVLGDEMLGWQELVMGDDSADELDFARIGQVRLVGSDADARALRAALSDRPVRITGPGEAVDRTDFVLPTVLVKERFGEFSFRPSGGDAIEIEQAWIDENIVTVSVEPLGEFRCHRKVVPYVRSAIADLDRTGLISEVDPADFQLAGGCWNPRLIRGGDKGFALSRHAWGIAIDINPSTNRYEGETSLSTAFGETFREWGFAWGAGWLTPDGMHFEWAQLAFPREHECSPLSLVSSPIPGVDWRIVERTSPC